MKSLESQGNVTTVHSTQRLTNLFGIFAEPALDALERGHNLGRVPELLDGAARLLRFQGHCGGGDTDGGLDGQLARLVFGGDVHDSVFVAQTTDRSLEIL